MILPLSAQRYKVFIIIILNLLNAISSLPLTHSSIQIKHVQICDYQQYKLSSNKVCFPSGEWSIDDATTRFEYSADGNYWKVAFQEGVDFIADLFQNYFYENTPKEYRNYATRFDLAFVTPCSHQLRCKVSQFKGLITWAATRPIFNNRLG